LFGWAINFKSCRSNLLFDFVFFSHLTCLCYNMLYLGDAFAWRVAFMTPYRALLFPLMLVLKLEIVVCFPFPRRCCLIGVSSRPCKGNVLKHWKLPLCASAESFWWNWLLKWVLTFQITCFCMLKLRWQSFYAIIKSSFMLTLSDPGSEKIVAPIVRFRNSSNHLVQLSTVLLPIDQMSNFFLRYYKWSQL
jgi:hypothetical protein